jgi:hypothetical protein
MEAPIHRCLQSAASSLFDPDVGLALTCFQPSEGTVPRKGLRPFPSLRSVREPDVPRFFGWQVSTRPSEGEKGAVAMSKQRSEAMECRVVGRLGREPEAKATTGGVTVCRMVVVKRAAGPASSPVRVGLYLKGALAERCRKGLHEGYLIEAFGELGNRQPVGKAPGYPEVVVDDRPDAVRLYARAGVAA